MRPLGDFSAAARHGISKRRGLALGVAALLVVPLAVNLSVVTAIALTAANVVGWAAVTLDCAARPYLARSRPAPAGRPDVLVVVAPLIRPLRAPLPWFASRGLPARVFPRYARGPLSAVIAAVTVPASRLLLLVTATTPDLGSRSMDGTHLPPGRRARPRRLGLVVAAVVVAWFIDRLDGVQKIQERTESTLQDVLEELRCLRVRLDGIERDVGYRDEAGTDCVEPLRRQA